MNLPMIAVLLESLDEVLRALFKCIRPLYAGGEATGKRRNVLTRVDQPLKRATGPIREHPEILMQPLIFTDGQSFVTRYGERKSLAFM